MPKITRKQARTKASKTGRTGTPKVPRPVKSWRRASTPGVMKFDEMTISRGRGPTFEKMGDGIRVRHTEYLGLISCGSTDYHYRTYVINPSLSSTFPWVHHVSPMYERYVVESLKVEYEHSTSPLTAGMVLFSFDHDASDPDTADFSALMQTKNRIKGPIHSDLGLSYVHPPGLQRLPLFTRPAATVPENEEIALKKQYDFAKLNMAWQADKVGETLGSISISYVIRFQIAQQPPASLN